MTNDLRTESRLTTAALLKNVQRKIIDLSIAIENDVASDPEPFRPKITYHKHDETHHQLLPFFPGLSKEDLPDEEAWAVEELQIGTHNGTHMDAPFHYHSTMDGGDRAWTIDEAPLDWCFKPGVKFDFRKFDDGYIVTARDIEAELARIGYTLQPLDIVLVNTNAGAAFGEPEYIHKGCGMGRDATLYLTDRGVRVVGTDAWSWDAPFSHTATKYGETRDPTIIWEGHKAGREAAYFQMEKLGNLHALPDHGFDVVCFPVKIKGASAGWTRTVAILA
ncbi:MAG: cyclase family protein [Pseudomonadota bacterium]